MDPIETFVESILAKVNLNVVFIVQLFTSIVKSLLNLWSKTQDVYTDWAMPFVACFVGLGYAFFDEGFSKHAVVSGLILGGGAIVAQTLWDKAKIGVAVARGASKHDPVIKEKTAASAADAAKQIERMKRLLKKPATPAKTEIE